MTDLIDVAERYYRAWAEKDRATIEGLVTEDLAFASPSHEFDSAAAFLDCCLEPFGGLSLDLRSRVPGEDELWVSYALTGPGGAPMHLAEHLRFRDGKISAIRVYFCQKG